MSGNIVPRTEKFDKIKAILRAPETLKEIKDALPEHITPEKMARVFLTACTTTPKLLDCEPASLMKAVVEASSLGLLPDNVLGAGYILPYGPNAKFIPGFRGLMDLARRSGKVAGIQARIIYEGDDFYYEYGSDTKLKHIPAQMAGDEPGAPVGAYASATLIDTGEVVFEVMWEEDIEAIRKRSPAGRSGPWVTDKLEMWRKTPLRRLMKYLPLSPEIQSAVASAEYAEAGVLGKLVEVKVDKETGEVIDAESVETLEDLVDDVEVDESDPGLTKGKGPISTDEEEKFQAAVQRVVSRAGEATSKRLADELFYKMLGTYGVEDIKEIRSRDTRKKFYLELSSEVDAWEDLA